MAAAEYGWIFVEVAAAAGVNTDLAFVHLTARAKAAAANLLKQQQQQSSSSSAQPPPSLAQPAPLAIAATASNQTPRSSQPASQPASTNATAVSTDSAAAAASVPPPASVAVSAPRPVAAAAATHQITPNASATMTMAHASANAADMDLQILERELQQISTALENGATFVFVRAVLRFILLVFSFHLRVRSMIRNPMVTQLSHISFFASQFCF
jgi:hypothetical protein